MDLSIVTIGDCLDMFERKDRIAVLENGQFIEFIEQPEEECYDKTRD